MINVPPMTTPRMMGVFIPGAALTTKGSDMSVLVYMCVCVRWEGEGLKEHESDLNTHQRCPLIEPTVQKEATIHNYSLTTFLTSMRHDTVTYTPHHRHSYPLPSPTLSLRHTF